MSDPFFQSEMYEELSDGLQVLEGGLKAGYKIIWQDDQWHVSDEYGEVIISANTLEKLVKKGVLL